MTSHPFKAIAVTAALALATAPLALAQTVAAGSDVWKTDGNGSYVSFVNNPIPAGFFCTGSPAFAGTIDLTGHPLATSPGNALRGADTVVVRDQSATFVNGVAQVSGRLVALSLKGKSTLTTSCSNGSVTWNVLAYADDQALPSNLTVVKSSALGGTFSGTLRVPSVVRFTNAADSTDVRELDNDIDFTVPSDAEWTNQPPSSDPWTSPQASVDTDADGTPDTAIPAASNFFPGNSPSPQPGCANPPCPVRIRHTAPQHSHFVFPPPKPCRVVVMPAPGPTTDTETTGAEDGTVEVSNDREIEASPSPSPSPAPCTTTTTTTSF